jgi:hypothetical protein
MEVDLTVHNRGSHKLPWDSYLLFSFVGGLKANLNSLTYKLLCECDGTSSSRAVKNYMGVRTEYTV